ncbi:MAG: prolyl oligopeptidase family serine peptidase [Acidobacteriota bacterium]
MRKNTCAATILFSFFLGTPAFAEKDYSLDRLFAYPNIYGTAPSALSWSPDSTTLAFLWNAQGERFRDIYLVRAVDGNVRRLTDVKTMARIQTEGDVKTPEQQAEEEAYDRGISEFVWSPDSRSLAFVLHGDLFMIGSAGRDPVREIVRSQTSESDLRYSPDGTLLSFVRSQNLWTVDLRTGGTRQLTALSANKPVSAYPAVSPIQEYEWSPDGSAIALMLWDTKALEDIVIPDYLPDRTETSPWKRSYTGMPVFETMLGVVGRDGGRIRWVEWGGEAWFNNSETEYNRSFAWSPDSKSLLINWNDGSYSLRRILVADRATLALRKVYEEKQHPFFWHIDALWSPDGSGILLTSEKDGYRHIYSVPAAGGPAVQLTKGPWDVLSLTVPPKGSEIVFTSSQPDPRERHVCMLPPAGGAPRRLSTAPGSYLPAVSDDGRRCAATYSRYLHPPDLLLLDPSGGAPRVVLKTEPPGLASVVRPEPEYVEFANEEDGCILRGLLLKPMDLDPSKKYPAVVSNVYAGTARNEWHQYDLLDMYMAEQLGFVILRVDFRASAGYGRDFHYGYYQKMGIVDSAEAVSAAKYLRSLPFVDPARIGIWGSSYGGFLTLMTLFTHPGAFQAGVAWKPVSDWRLYTDDYTAQRLGRPVEFPDVYTRTSPITHVNGLADPLLIIHGMQDDNVLFQDTVRLVQKLLESGKTFDVAFYPRSNHTLTYWQECRMDLMKRTARFLEQHLGPGLSVAVPPR